MKSHPWIVLASTLGLAPAPGAPSRADETPGAVPADHARRMQEGLALFKEKVRPVLIQQCLDCHGGKKTKGAFDLSDRKSLMESGAIDDGRESLLYSLITHEEEPHMPQKAPKLPDATIEQIARWIELGAPYDRPLVERAKGGQAQASAITAEDRAFWSFRRLSPIAPPEVADADADADASWARTPIDRFVLAKQREKGLRPNPPADRRTLIRRVSFDLVGLPPTPGEVDAFVNDPAPDAYERLV